MFRDVFEKKNATMIYEEVRLLDLRELAEECKDIPESDVR